MHGTWKLEEAFQRFVHAAEAKRAEAWKGRGASLIHSMALQ
jgi:hypothetical protein